MVDPQQFAEQYKAASNNLLLRFFRSFRMCDLELLKFVEKEDRILDCGCGSGYCLNYLNKRGYNNLYGIDIEEKFLTEIKNKLYNIRKLSVTDAHKEFPPSYFDIVLCYDLFHHLTSLEEYKQAVYALKTILKDNGYLFIADPDNNLFFKTMVYCSKIFTPIFPAFRLTAKNYFDTEKQEFDLYFANKEFLYKLLDRDFKIIKTKRAFYRSITIFQKIIK